MYFSINISQVKINNCNSFTCTRTQYGNEILKGSIGEKGNSKAMLCMVVEREFIIG